jgi:hypothetical protein
MYKHFQTRKRNMVCFFDLIKAKINLELFQPTIQIFSINMEIMCWYINFHFKLKWNSQMWRKGVGITWISKLLTFRIFWINLLFFMFNLDWVSFLTFHYQQLCYHLIQCSNSLHYPSKPSFQIFLVIFFMRTPQHFSFYTPL